MKKEIRKLLRITEPSTFSSPVQFIKWLFVIRKQENLFYENSIEAPEQYKYSEDFIKELFWQITCFKYLQSLGMSITDENLEGIEKLIRKYNDIKSIKTLMPSLTVDVKILKLSAWDVSKELDTLVNSLDDLCDNTKEIQHFLYLLRHVIGHSVRPTLIRFVSNLSNHLKNL